MASKGINKVILVGNLGNDPEMKYLPNGSAIANVTIATGESYKDKNSGQLVEKTEWHRVVFFGKLAEIVGEYVHKGSKIYVEGKLQTRKWQDQSGSDRYSTEIVVDGFTGQMQMLDSKSSNQGAPQQPNKGQQQSPRRQQAPQQQRQQAPQQMQQQAPQQPQPQRQPQQQPVNHMQNTNDDGWDEDAPF